MVIRPDTASDHHLFPQQHVMIEGSTSGTIKSKQHASLTPVTRPGYHCIVLEKEKSEALGRRQGMHYPPLGGGTNVMESCYFLVFDSMIDGV